MDFHILLELITAVFAFSTVFFSYPLYKKHVDVPSLFWFVNWGIWMGLFSLTHALLSLVSSSPNLFINCTGDLERIVNATFIMFCVYPGKTQDGIIFYLTRKQWLNILMPFIMISSISLSFIPDDFVISHDITIFFKILQIIIISIIFGRLVDIISKWAKLLRVALFFILFSAIASTYSIALHDSLFYLAVLFKVACYTTMMITITYLWVRISTYNGNTLKQIIGVYYGSSKTRNNL